MVLGTCDFCEAEKLPDRAVWQDRNVLSDRVRNWVQCQY